jgi:hypothetical protein
MANSLPEMSRFGLVTNEDEKILFVKLRYSEDEFYALSWMFAPFTSRQELLWCFAGFEADWGGDQ